MLIVFVLFNVTFQGRRNLVVAANGSTKVFSKSGKQVKSFPSSLPGGNRNQSRGKQNRYTILDCIYSESNSMFYILDMMCWDGFQYYDCETEFRPELPQILFKCLLLYCSSEQKLWCIGIALKKGGQLHFIAFFLCL